MELFMENRIGNFKESLSEITIEKAFLYLSLLITTALVLFFALGSSVVFHFIVGGVFKERLQVTQNLFTEGISQDLIIGSNQEAYRKCKMFFAESDVVSVKITTSFGDEICHLAKAADNTLSIDSKIYFDEAKSNIAGSISVRYSLDKLYSVHLRILIGIFSLLFVFLTLQVVILKKIGRTVTQPIRALSDKLKNGDLEDFVGETKKTRIIEIDILSEGLRTLSLNSLENQKSKILQAEGEAAIQVAKQVSHDIRSPLSALTMVVGTLKEIPEEKRVLIRNATQRINDIANDLLQKGKNLGCGLDQNIPHSNNETVHINHANELATEFIPAVIDVLVSEKRMQYREHAGLDIEVDLRDSFGAFSQVNSNELKRVISNLINNAVEAFSQHQGRVNVRVKKSFYDGADQVEIIVKDNGKGIPTHILDKLGKQEVSHGKEDLKSAGSGIGVFHAKRTIESFGGKMQIESQEGQGTLITITLPLASTPSWFANKIDLTGKMYLVSLDDDISIHQIWNDRLKSAGYKDIEHIRFQSGDAFVHFVNANINKLMRTVFLVDYELLNQSKSGLDLIEYLGIEKYSILVTSRYEESIIQDRAARLRLSLLPKSLAGFVPFERETPKERYDWVLIDDDDLVHMTWKFAAKDVQKTFLGFKTHQEFNAYKKNLDKDLRIYIDSNLGGGIKGEEVAKQLFDEGFKNLFLATGYSAQEFLKLEFLKGVVGKDPPVGT